MPVPFYTRLRSIPCQQKMHHAFEIQEILSNIFGHCWLDDRRVTVDLLALVSAWPHLEQLWINRDWDWNTLDGITPNGLLQLLQMCWSLSSIGLAIDTRGHTEFSQSPTGHRLTFPPEFSIDVLDSVIEVGAVTAIVTFITDIIMPGSRISLCAWDGKSMRECPKQKLYRFFWSDVCLRVTQRSC